MKLLYKIKFGILISTKTLFFIKTSYNEPVRKTPFCVVFTGYGMSSFPFSLIGGSNSVHSLLSSVEMQISSIQNRLDLMRQEGATLNEFEQQEIGRLEREERLLVSQRRILF